MRWRAVQIGDKRTITTFTLIPIKVNCQWSWFEIVKIRQRFTPFGWANSWVEK